MGTGKLIIFSALHGYEKDRAPLGQRYLAVTGGAMIDDFDRAAHLRQQSKEYMANTVEVMRKASREGKLVVFTAWLGFTWSSDEEIIKRPAEEIDCVARERITFPLACF